MRAGGVDFGNYMKNPVFLRFHNPHDFPLGKVTKFWVEGDSVKAIVYFPTLEELSSDMKNVSEEAKTIDFVYYAYKTGLLNAVSVGFIPLEWTETKTGYDITKWELLEFSAVAVPANQDAIAEAVKSFGLDESVVKDFFTTQKSGKRISAETKEVLNKIKACGDEIEKCRDQLKNIAKNMNELLAELDEAEENLTDGDEPIFDAVNSYEITRCPGGFIYKNEYAGLCFVPEANTGVGVIKHSVAKTEPKKMVTK